MKQETTTVTIILEYSPNPQFEMAISRFIDSSFIEKIFIIRSGGYKDTHPKCEIIKTDLFISGKTLNKVLSKIKTKHFLFISQAQDVKLNQFDLKRMTVIAEQTGPEWFILTITTLKTVLATNIH